MMKLILREDVANLGVIGDLVTVRDGYGRNFLIPQGKAVLASLRSVRELDHQKRLALHYRSKATAESEVAKKKIEGLSLLLTAKVAQAPTSEGGAAQKETLQRLFGSVTNRDIANALKNLGVTVDARKITLSEQHVRTVGKFSAKVRLDGGLSAELPFWVLPEGTVDVESEKKRVEAA